MVSALRGRPERRAQRGTFALASMLGTIRDKRSIPLKRNTLVLGAVLLILATFAWAGWANFEYRKQAAEKLAAANVSGELVMDNSSGMPKMVSPLNGKPAPVFTLEDLSGKKVSLTNYKGKAVLINFWANWCAPCRIETPWIIELRNQYAGQGFEVLGVSTDDLDSDNVKTLSSEKKEIAAFVAKMHMPYPILLAGDQLDHPYGGLDVLPESFFVDRTGKVVAVQFGLTSKDDIEGNIKKALTE
jgi:thiol-disulfide isomerase/thioredoxin